MEYLRRPSSFYFSYLQTYSLCILAPPCLIFQFRHTLFVPSHKNEEASKQDLTIILRPLHAIRGISEFGVMRRARERDDITDVRHARYEKQQTLETETEAGMGTGAVLTRIEIPPHVLHRDVQLLNACQQLVVAFLTFRAADNLSDLGRLKCSSTR